MLWKRRPFLDFSSSGAQLPRIEAWTTTCGFTSRVPPFLPGSCDQDCKMERACQAWPWMISGATPLPCTSERWGLFCTFCTWYKGTTPVVVPQLKVRNCCCILKGFEICIQILINATTFLQPVSNCKVNAFFISGEFDLLVGSNSILHLLHDRRAAAAQVGSDFNLFGWNFEAAHVRRLDTHVASPFAKLQEPQSLESLLLSLASRTSSWLLYRGNHV